MAPSSDTTPSVDLLGGDFNLLGGPVPAMGGPVAAMGGSVPTMGVGADPAGLDLFSLQGALPSGGYVAPKQVWLTAQKGKGLEIEGTFSRSKGQMSMDLTFTNRAMQPMTGFAIQFNKNSFGISPTMLQVPSPLLPNASATTSLTLNCSGPIQKMEPLTNLQVR